jgi:plasmid replication initiation protein
LRKKDIEFAYVNQQGQTEDVTTGIINTVRNIRDTDYITVEISTWAIPYLLYWGKGVGGTIYQKAIAVRLKGLYAKRLYKMCCRWQDKGGFDMPLAEFRKMFKIENKYKQPSDLRKRVLNPAQKELKKNADLYFEYDIHKIQSRAYNHITFKIFSQKAPKPEENTSYWYQFVYNFITRTYPAYKDDKALRITDQLAENSETLRAAYTRFLKIRDEYNKEQKGDEDIIRLTKHILKNDFEINVK